MSSRDPILRDASGGSSRTEGLDHPDTLGPYKIRQVVGEGGMGIVYDAEQLEPVRRRVALKMMKVGMDTREVVARFEAERQALAMMDHPGIARVLDAGASETGRPYFVMEYVKGVPLTEYCDARQLSTRARLALFIPICHAVQHAHQKGVIHRDLKPTNVLITEQHGEPAPKIIDFGIAKAISQRLTEKTLLTAFGVAMGTPAYMSPEQAEMSGLDVDTRTDIYSLGVMLYELLLGELPANPFEIGMQAFIAQLVMRDTATPTPSIKLSATGEADRIAALRGTRPGELRRELRGDLDWIVLKAMDKDRNRRYETANGLAMDLERFLRNEPVVARPPTAGYRFRKFVRRNKAAFAAGAAVAMALVAGVIATTAGMVRASRAEAVARQEAATAALVSDFLVGLFEVNNPTEARGNTITVREVLDSGAARIATDLKDQPLVQARLMHTMGRVYSSLALYGTADSLAAKAVATRRQMLGPQHLDVAASMRLLASVRRQQGDFVTADSLLSGVWELSRETAPDTALAGIVRALGWLRLRQGRYDEADSLLRRALDYAERGFGPEDLRTAGILQDIAFLHDDDPAVAEPLFRRALDIHQDRAPQPDASTATLLHNLGLLKLGTLDYAEADSLVRQALSILEAVYADVDHPAVVRARGDLGLVYRDMGRFREADSVLGHVITDLSRIESDRSDVPYYQVLRAGARLELGDYELAEELLREAQPGLTRSVGREHHWMGILLTDLGRVYAGTSRLARAEESLRNALAIEERNWGAGHRVVAHPLTHLARVLQQRGQAGEAASLYVRVLEIAERAALPPRLLQEAVTGYQEVLRELGRAEDASAVDTALRRRR